MRTIEAIFVGPLPSGGGKLYWRLDDGTELLWCYSPMWPVGCQVGRRYTVATDGRQVYPATIL